MIGRGRKIAVGLMVPLAALAWPYPVSAKEVPSEALACGVDSASDELRTEFALAAPDFKNAPDAPPDLMNQWLPLLAECMERHGIAWELREAFLKYSIGQILTGQIEGLMAERGLDVGMFSNIADRILAEDLGADFATTAGLRLMALLEADGHDSEAITREHGILLGGYLAMRIIAFQAVREMER